MRADYRICAAAVPYVLGQIDFLFDHSQKPHLTAAQLAAGVGAEQTTMAGKRWQHPMAWIGEVDGLLVDTRELPDRSPDAHGWRVRRLTGAHELGEWAGDVRVGSRS